MKKTLDYIFLTRPVLFPPVWTILILGARAAAVREGASPFATTGLDGVGSNFWLLMLFATCLYGAGYTFNQIYDIESDRQNSKLFFLAEGMISKSSAHACSFLLNAIALAGGFYLSTQIGILFMIIVVLGFLYSHPITNFKGKPSHGYWSNAFGHGMIPFMIGWAIVDSVTLETALKSFPYLFGVGAIYLNTTLPDREGDKAVGKLTHGVLWGPRTTMKASVFLVILSIILAQMSGDYAWLIAGLISLPFFIRALMTNRMEDIVRSPKLAILALSLFACIYLPAYIALLAIGFILARQYYRWRFEIEYPTVGL